MKPGAFRQEILLVTSSSFSQRQWCEYNGTDSQGLSPLQQVEYACWNGLLYELLPEISLKSSCGKDLLFWHIRVGDNFLQIEFIESPMESESVFSIDSSYFLTDLLFN